MTFLLALLLALVALAQPLRADVVPGDVITDQNVDRVKELVSPGLEWCILHGWPITIGETRRLEWLKPYKEATEKYSSQV